MRSTRKISMWRWFRNRAEAFHDKTKAEALAQWHRWNIVKDKIAKLKVKILDGAPKSPDLNLTEML